MLGGTDPQGEVAANSPFESEKLRVVLKALKSNVWDRPAESSPQNAHFDKALDAEALVASTESMETRNSSIVALIEDDGSSDIS